MIFNDIDFEPGWHVIPADDLKEHTSTLDCWCRPYLDCASDGLVYIHQSLDGREREVN
jgi:hypothetical protein